MRMKKGYVETIGWTILVLIAVVTVAAIVLIVSAIPRAVGNSAGSSEFVAGSSKSSALAYTLAYLLIEDRQFIEQANEIAVTSVEKSGSKKLSGFLDDFIRNYRRNAVEEVNLVTITVYNETDQKFQYTNFAENCGDNFEGFCVLSARAENGCGKGSTKIADAHYTKESQRCSIGVCCVENLDASGNYPAAVKKCGSSLKGVCDSLRGGSCFPGRLKTEDSDDICKTDGMICCLPVKSENFLSTGITARAEIPLLFNESFGKLAVTIG